MKLDTVVKIIIGFGIITSLLFYTGVGVVLYLIIRHLP